MKKNLPIALKALVVVTMTLLPTGTQAAPREKVLHSFNNDGKDGFNPQAGVISDTAGNLYGTTSVGGDGCSQGGCGTVFELTPKANGGWTEEVLHTFGKGDDGAVPYAGRFAKGSSASG